MLITKCQAPKFINFLQTDIQLPRLGIFCGGKGVFTAKWPRFNKNLIKIHVRRAAAEDILKFTRIFVYVFIYVFIYLFVSRLLAK